MSRRLRLTIQVGIPLKVHISSPRSMESWRRPKHLVEEKTPKKGGGQEQDPDGPREGHEGGWNSFGSSRGS